MLLNLTLAQIARRLAGANLVWLAQQTITGANGDPNNATDPTTAGFDVTDVLFGVYRIGPPAGVSVDYRVWYQWTGKSGEWDLVDGSDRSGVDVRTTQELKLGGVDRVYIERTDASGSDWTAEIGEKQ